MPAGKAIHLILDNHATHKHAKVRDWLARHPRWTCPFTPTSFPERPLLDRFKKAARALECDDDDTRFDAKLKKIATAPKPKDEKQDRDAPDGL